MGERKKSQLDTAKKKKGGRGRGLNVNSRRTLLPREGINYKRAKARSQSKKKQGSSFLWKKT